VSARPGGLATRPAPPVPGEPLRVVALGDSISSGDGVGVLTPPDRTWTALLAGWLAPTQYVSLAAAGAKVRDVLAGQLPPTADLRPHLVTLCVGLNDLVKTDCGPRLTTDLTALLVGLRAGGATVVVTRLHDPGVVFRMPRGLAAQVTARVALVNAVVDQFAATDPGVLPVDLGVLVAEPACWAVDRVHPSVWGQAVLARTAASRLGLAPPPHEAVPPPPPGGLAHAAWVVRSGLPWLARRCGEVGPAVGGMAVSTVRRTPSSP